MDIGLTDEQKLLQDTVSALADQLATTNPSEIAGGEALAQRWRQVVEVGIPTLRSPALCGLEASGVETALAVEQLARRLCAVPVAGQAVLAAELLEAARAEKELDLLAEGQLRIAPVLTADLRGFGTLGAGAVAFDTAGATHVLVAEEIDGCRRLGTVALDGAAAEDGLDLTRAVRRLPADGPAEVTVVGEPIADERWRRVEALALTVIAADLLGVMQGALDDAVRYAGERSQFGVPIGSFQAIQHLLADALVSVEGARSCVWHAAWAIDHLPIDEAVLAAMTAKAYASAAGRDVVETTVQVFGGIAITWEHLSHLRVRRTLLNRRLFGDETTQYEPIAELRLANEELA
ncbi:acyl-CoA dehydrogenase family protein [Mycolicibacterium thermoresistibile]|uniref:Acyl-CoA dehydrogenase domain-containing protein n=2 Tax=Mycolicibacterium thermoresistibile TaxID=1797 RepID=G7CFT8_MYCT3|nr:acyl-CoA dehydrogenase family protein [Mycolicibacterium thermoresistibile]EHI13367.1 acyl-CoA dehydrogenase domain-containing protein [Mycolicibacterium thermoresistibile ATCC 19527]MCV7189160.1 acyl-CoA dehydrogenase [Mycolicibacterium thermoresistibile]GAT14650.1 acyl-CoA dehydrogenase [Mycolicibacterium thermoresistibile]SNW19877.1 acyl-CoA dehydrogenase [Mycolicibacterium thermoresistibile]